MGCLGEIQNGDGNRISTPSTPPAWAWRDEKYLPVPYPGAFAAMAEDQYESLALSTDSRKVPDSATLREQNDSNPDPTYQDCWPSERYKSDGPDGGDQCSECRSAPGQPHAPGCDVSSSPVISCDRKDDAPGTPTVDFYMAAALAAFDFGPECDEAAKVTDSVINVESCPECGAVTDLDYGESVPCGQRVGEDGICGYWGGLLPKRESGSEEETLDPALDAVQCFSVPFPVQEFLFESLAEHALDNLHNLIDDHYGIILKMARARFHRGYVDHGSEMYSWSPERRFEETLQELADAVVYPTSGSLE